MPSNLLAALDWVDELRSFVVDLDVNIMCSAGEKKGCTFIQSASSELAYSGF